MGTGAAIPIYSGRNSAETRTNVKGYIDAEGEQGTTKCKQFPQLLGLYWNTAREMGMMDPGDEGSDTLGEGSHRNDG